MSLDQSERSKWSRQQAQNLILRIFLIIIIIIRCSGMFRDIPGCSGMFHVPAFIDALKTIGVSNELYEFGQIRKTRNQSFKCTAAATHLFKKASERAKQKL